MIERVKGIIKANKTIAENFIYITLLQVFLLVATLITYPYLVKVLCLSLIHISEPTRP